VKLELVLNGRPAVWEIEPGESLLDALRRHGVWSVKRGCETGDCGCCTALLDGQPVATCVVAAARARGTEVTTLEGLAGDPILEKLRAVFLAEGAVQCGYCTPGMLLVAWTILRDGSRLDEVAVRQALSGSLCRCTGYVKPVRAILLAAQQLRAMAGRGQDVARVPEAGRGAPEAARGGQEARP
jgi:aerobic-type carbon monoxide dehydrogenase small subunit (CoxS/CutS family)